MMKILLTCLIGLMTLGALAQAPELMSYQGVARDNSGNILVSQNIGLRISLRSGSTLGTIVYQETHQTNTNAFGLFNIQIGNGSVVSGNMGTIDWGGNSYYVQVEMDPSGGTTYTDMGTSRLISVPFALYAKSGGTVYNAGTGVNINNNTISADNANAIWNANNLQGNAISVQQPTVGQVLTWDGSQWVPSDPPTGGGGGTAATDLIYTIIGF